MRAAEKEQRKKLENEYIEKEFIGWMLEELDQQQLGVLYVAAGMEENLHKACKLPKKFLVNNLLLKNRRVRLAEKRIVPIAYFLLEEINGKKEWTDIDIIEKGEQKKADVKEIALSLFLQNYYAAAYALYEHSKKDGDSKEIEKEIEKEKEKKADEKEHAGFERKTSKKQQKAARKLELKAETLALEKGELQSQVRALKAEIKQLQQEKAKETADLRQQLGKSEARAQKLEEQVVQLQKAAEEKKEEPVIGEPVEKVKIALLGNPKNSKILRSDELQIDVFEAEEIERLVEKITQYKRVFYVRYAIDQVLIERSMPEEIRKQMIPVENFLELRRRLGGLSNV